MDYWGEKNPKTKEVILDNDLDDYWETHNGSKKKENAQANNQAQAIDQEESKPADSDNL